MSAPGPLHRRAAQEPGQGGLDLLRSSFMPLGDGTHKLPIQEGDTVSIHLSERLG
jgi:hypothetical protein